MIATCLYGEHDAFRISRIVRIGLTNAMQFRYRAASPLGHAKIVVFRIWGGVRWYIDLATRVLDSPPNFQVHSTAFAFLNLGWPMITIHLQLIQETFFYQINRSIAWA